MVNIEATAMGVAYLAGLNCGYWHNFSEIKKNIKIDNVFKPKMDAQQAVLMLREWQKALQKTII